MQGPIDDAFMSSFLMVTPSGKAHAPKVHDWAYAEQMRAIARLQVSRHTRSRS